MAARHRAAEIHAGALRHDAMNADLMAKPRMILIENFAELGPVGVLKPRCSTCAKPSSASASVRNQWAFRLSALRRPLKASMNALSVGLPGREKSSVTPSW